VTVTEAKPTLAAHTTIPPQPSFLQSQHQVRNVCTDTPSIHMDSRNKLQCQHFHILIKKIHTHTRQLLLETMRLLATFNAV